jgi:hypothetical protein
MNNNRNTDNDAYLAALFAALVTILLASIYFLVEAHVKDPSWKGFLQGISGNIIATTMSFLVVYMFITRRNVLGDSKNTYQQISNRVDSVITLLEDEILPIIENKLDLNNSSFEKKFDSLKSDLDSQLKQIGQEIEIQVNTGFDSFDLDSNELYRFYGLQGTKTGMTFQNFRVSRDSDSKNTNAVSHLWADTLYGDSVSAKIINDKIEPFLRIDFQSFENSWGCNVTIRPQDQKAIDRKSQDLNYLSFRARIPTEILYDTDSLHDIGISILIVNGKYQHWDYANRAGEYIQFPVKQDGTWSVICIDLHDKTRWCHFTGDGNQYINEDERNNADLSIISAITLKIGRYQSRRGELGYGKGRVDIKDIRFEPDPVKIA